MALSVLQAALSLHDLLKFGCARHKDTQDALRPQAVRHAHGPVSINVQSIEAGSGACNAPSLQTHHVARWRALIQNQVIPCLREP